MKSAVISQSLKINSWKLRSMLQEFRFHFDSRRILDFHESFQANNGFLQRLPVVIFTLFAGPMSDTFGRKPLLICPIIGFLILNLVLLLNSFFFHALKVHLRRKISLSHLYLRWSTCCLSACRISPEGGRSSLWLPGATSWISLARSFEPQGSVSLMQSVVLP